MNDTTKYCIAAVACLAILLGAPIGCSVRTNSQVIEAIQAGATPRQAACAIKGGDSTDKSVCMAAALEARK